jgi:predicted Zn finger-like uncharacterized protein
MDGKLITACPACGCRYRVSERFAGASVSCKKCGALFTVRFDAESAETGDGRPVPEAQDIGVDDHLLVLGKLAVKFEMASPSEVEEALSRKADLAEKGEQVSLGDMLVTMGVIGPNQLNFLLSVQRMKETQQADRRFGLIAEKNRFVTPEDLQEALRIQKEAFLKDRTILRIGEVLVERGLLSSQQCNAILKRQKALGDEDFDIPAPPLPGTAGDSPEAAEPALAPPAEGVENAGADDPAQTLVLKELETGEGGETEEAGDDAEPTQTLTITVPEAPAPAPPLAEEEEEEEAAEEPVEAGPGSAGFGGAPGKLKSGDIKVRVSRDRMRAELVCKGEPPPGLTVRKIRRMLSKAGVTHGIVDDKRLGEFLEGASGGGPWPAAEGTWPKPGSPARIVYGFDPDPLKTGAHKAGGVVDFGAGGLTGPVLPGHVLAGVEDRVPASPGMNVLGKPVPPPEEGPEAPAPVLTCGRGVVLKDSARVAEAASAGRPETAFDGRILVRPELVIGGDVGADTGNISFDGCVIVEGTIRTGHVVKAGRLVCQGIGQADVHVEGDVVVLGGIQGAAIRACGAVRAAYVRSATVLALGDVMVEQEIRDSKVETAGACILGTGRILASEIYARQGVEAGQIGSLGAKPPTVVVGTEKRVKSELAWIKGQVAERKKRLKTLLSEEKEREDRVARLQKQIGQLSGVEEKGAVEKSAVEEELAREKVPARRERLERRLWDINEHARETRNVLESLYAGQDELAEEAMRGKRERERLEREVDALAEEAVRVKEWVKGRATDPVLRAYGMIYPQTTVIGPGASLVLKEQVSRVVVREVREPGGAAEMRLSRML